jgi:hypothetical protein
VDRSEAVAAAMAIASVLDFYYSFLTTQSLDNIEINVCSRPFWSWRIIDIKQFEGLKDRDLEAIFVWPIHSVSTAYPSGSARSNWLLNLQTSWMTSVEPWTIYSDDGMPLMNEYDW